MTLSSNAIEILKSLLYYDIFRHPLKKEEIALYSSLSAHDDWTKDLLFLLEQQLIHERREFYYIGNDWSIVEKRIRGNKLATIYLKHVRRHAYWLSKLPFIQCICISGSLSKHYMTPHSDVDYFIITDPNRVWFIRLFSTLLEKVLNLVDAKKYLCPNYVISLDNLELKDRNIFTATEMATLIPVYNVPVYDQFMAANTWVHSFLPNFKNEAVQSRSHRRPASPWYSFMWDFMDLQLYKVYKAYYKQKFDHLIKGKSAPTDFVFERGCFKAHSTSNRNKILDKFEEKIRQYETIHDIHLTHSPVLEG